jgi:hemerythrin-like domain-containing protein
METALRYFRHAAPHHTADEEDGLFPALAKDHGGDDELISELERDHRRAERLHGTVDRLGHLWLAAGNLAERRVVHLQAALAELSALYQEHIRIEEQRIFPSARALLSREALEEIGRGMASRRGLSYTPAMVTAIAGMSRSTPIETPGFVEVLQQQEKED